VKLPSIKVVRNFALGLVICACCLLPGLNARAQKSNPQPAKVSGCTLRIHVDGLRNSTGVVGAAVFKSHDGWPEDMSKTLNHWPTPIAPGAHEAISVMENLPPGDYGVVAIHDENRNHKLDRNFIGIPKEGFGFANNPHVGLSAPSFDAAIVHVTCPVTEINIHIIYK
jgi:uncharacterized protein (DUF2141 family)